MKQNLRPGVLFSDMQSETMDRLQSLEKGQLWKLDHGYLYIAELGTPHIHYKMLRTPQQTVAMTRMIGIEALVAFLKHSSAELVAGASANRAQQ
jgi:hypothetical protein